MSLADRNTIIKELTKLQLHHLDIHTAKKYFKKIGSSFTWYVIENTPAYKDISVEGRFGNKHFKSSVPSMERDFIPLLYTATVFSILSKTIDNNTFQKFSIETTSDLHKYTKKNLISDVESEQYPYRLIHTPTQTLYSSRPHKYQNGFKVFLSTTNTYRAFVDNCGMTQSIAFIRCKDKEEAEEIATILSHPLYKFINNICRWGNFNNVRILQRFPIPNNKTDIYGSFKITKEEQIFINDYL